MKLLLIEDDRNIGCSLQQYLTENGILCRWVRDGEEGWELARGREHEVIVLDILLPSRDGRDILRQLRKEGIQTPVILLTALGTVEHRISGLGGGADDYLVKPFEFAELLARVKAISRRYMQRPSPDINVNGVRLDLSTRQVFCNGAAIDLTPTESSLLEFLMRHAGQLVTRKMISAHLWDASERGKSNVVDVNVNRLRAKLERAGRASPIQTVRGRGYVFHNAAEQCTDPAVSSGLLEHGRRVPLDRD